MLRTATRCPACVAADVRCASAMGHAWRARLDRHCPAVAQGARLEWNFLVTAILDFACSLPELLGVSPRPLAKRSNCA
jgi:hypothetical protein